MRRPPLARARALARTLRPHALVVALPLAAGAAEAAAQERPVAPWERRGRPTFAIGAGGLYASSHGSGDARVGDGYGFDVHGSVGVSAFALGVGFQRTVQPVAALDADATRQGVYVEPRVAVAPYGSFTPYLAGRVGFLQERIPGVGGAATTRERRTSLGGGAGLLVSLAPSVQLDLAGLYQHVERGGTTTGARTGGDGALVRAGVVLGFDRWGR